jgi:transcriptional regulator with XRE-family HTH domain
MAEAAATLLRDVRQRHGITQAQLAARARTSQAAISRIERGLVSPSSTMLARLLDLMGEELILGAEPIDYGIDRTLIRENLQRTPEERIDFIASFSNFVREFKGFARGAR